MSKSSIEWTTETWNPIVGCSIVSPGCTNCYAMQMASRIQKMNRSGGSNSNYVNHYDGTTKAVNGKIVWTGKLAMAPDKIFMQPLSRKTPTTYFVNSMGDLFHEDCPDEWIDRVFAVMALAPQHTFQVLTKRAGRMRDYCGTIQKNGRWLQMEDIALQLGYEPRGADDHGFDWISHKQFLPNVWLGVSTERQQEYDERKEHLRATPAAVHFFSMEPLLGPIIADYLGDWVIAGGESGPNARPSHPDWHRSLRDQCDAAGVAFFFKQWGSFAPIIDRDNDDPDWRRDYVRSRDQPNRFKILNLAGGCGFHGERVHLMQRFSKVDAGRTLDGLEHNAMPKGRP